MTPSSIVIFFQLASLSLNIANVAILNQYNTFYWIVTNMIKLGGNSFKNLRVCLKTSQILTLNKACVKSCCVVKNLTFLRNMCIISTYFMLCRPSYAKPKDCSIMNRINLTDKIMLPPLSKLSLSPSFQPCAHFLFIFLTFLSSVTP